MTPEHESEKNGIEDGGIAPIQEAEFAVQSSIAVREEYKAKLQALLEAVSGLAMSRNRAALPQTVFPTVTNGKSGVKSTSKTASAKGAATAAEQLRIPQGKEMQIVGDWLLLMRAASVNVVEKIQSWRQIVHQGRPHPFLHEGTNYLLAMCEDADVLDQSADLVEWLGFRLARNPFIVQGSLDDAISDVLGKSVHNERSLKYWSSSSWWKQKKKTLEKKAKDAPESDPTARNAPAAVGRNRVKEKKSRPHGRATPPPQALVKPLASILPEDDVVDGARIGAAQQVLLEEEGFYGRLRALRAIRQYFVDVACADERERQEEEEEGERKESRYATVYDEIAGVTTQVKCVTHQYSITLLPSIAVVPVPDASICSS